MIEEIEYRIKSFVLGLISVENKIVDSWLVWAWISVHTVYMVITLTLISLNLNLVKSKNRIVKKYKCITPLV